MERIVAITLACCGLAGCLPTSAVGSPFARLLPPASEFRLTLREDLRSSLPLGSSCTGEAARTLTCRAFTFTLENASSHTVRISGLTCQQPDITISRKEPRATGGWWPVSQPSPSHCTTLIWSNIRLKPGEHTEYATRLIAPGRDSDAFPPGTYTLRARWTLFGCTEGNDASDCLAPLQVIHAPSSISSINAQEPVTVESNEVVAEAPSLPALRNLSFALEVTVRPDSSGIPTPDKRTGSCTEGSNAVECAGFHYTIHNIGTRAVRHYFATCPGSDAILSPEYRVAGGKWQPVPVKKSGVVVCISSVMLSEAILPGGSLEGGFTLPSLGNGYYDATKLEPANEYNFRFTFHPSACIASPDGSFCLTTPEQQSPVVSREVVLQAGQH